MIKVTAAGISETGPYRETNEDSIASHAPEDMMLLERKGCLFLLADGVGGQAAGEVASATTVEVILQEYYAASSPARIEPALRNAVQAANLRVYDLSQRHLEYHSMQTTLSALAIAGSQAYVAHVGDSRIYHWRNGRLTQLTSDHSEAAELVRMKVLDKAKIREHPRRNILTRALGGHLLLRPDFLRQQVLPGDRFLQCTDGLWSEVQDDEIAAMLGDCEPDEACRLLVDLAISRDGQDNISVQAVKVLNVGEDPQPTASANWLGRVLQRVGRG